MPETHRIGAGTGASTRSRLPGASLRKAQRDARRRERLKISLPLLARPFDPRFEGIEDVGQVVDFTRDGLYFTTCMPHYFLGMHLIVTFPYGDKISAHRKFLVTVVRLEHRGMPATGWRCGFCCEARTRAVQTGTLCCHYTMTIEECAGTVIAF